MDPNRPSLWALAFEDLEKCHPDLSRAFAGYVTKSQISPHELAFRANDTIKGNYNDNSNSKSATFRKYLEGTVKYILSAKDYVSDAVESNPYASMAWAGVCLVLPLITKSTEENEAAIEGLNVISKLFIEYRWKEKTYRKGSSADDFDRAARKLYSAILEYEARLLTHLQSQAIKRFAKDVFNAGQWKESREKIEGLAADCSSVTDAMSKDFAESWRHDEKAWQDELLRLFGQQRLDEEHKNVRLLYSSYEAGKNLNPVRAPKAGEWFLTHPDFLSWREASHSKILWLSAQPGCGKSVLSKYLVDRKGEALSVKSDPPVLCYFFFKNDGNSDQRNDASVALRALLHQLFLQRPHFYSNAKQSFETKDASFLREIDALWNIFEACIMDSIDDEMICVLDALDECREEHRTKLLKNILDLQKRLKARQSSQACKFLLTSQPHWKIERDLKPLIDVEAKARIVAEHETDAIEEEINYVVDIRVKELAEVRGLNQRSSQTLIAKLKKTKSRTYLWLRLVLDILYNELNLNSRNIERILSTIPRQVEEVYMRILDRSPEPQIARKLLHVVLAAATPLTMMELGVAVAVNEQSQSWEDVEDEMLWTDDTARTKIQNICGLFLTVIDSKVYLIHSTAKTFLIRQSSTIPPPQSESSHLQWKESFDLTESNLVLARACIYFLLLDGLPDVSAWPGLMAIKSMAQYPLFEYAIFYWALHFKPADSVSSLDAKLIQKVISELHSVAYRQRWARIYALSSIGKSALTPPFEGPPLLWSAHFGHLSALQQMLESGTDPDARDRFQRTALMFAAETGRLALVQLLLDNGADTNAIDLLGQTPLTFAVQSNHEAVGRALQHAGSRMDFLDLFGRTPCSYSDAVQNLSQPLDHSLDIKPTSNEQINEPAGLPEQVRLYFQARLIEDIWIARADVTTVHLTYTHPTRSFGLVRGTIHALNTVVSAKRESFIRAREVLIANLSTISDLVAAESPFTLFNILRLIAYCSHYRLGGIRGLLCSSLLQKADHASLELDPFHRVLKRLKDAVGTHDSAADDRVRSVCFLSIDSVIQALASVLGPYHGQTICFRHARMALQRHLLGAHSTLNELRDLSTGVDKQWGPTSPQALTLLGALSEMELESSDYTAAELHGEQLVQRSKQLLAAREDNRERHLYRLCTGYHLIAQAQVEQGKFDDAEMAARNALSNLDPKYDSTERPQGTLSEWLEPQDNLMGWQSTDIFSSSRVLRDWTLGGTFSFARKSPTPGKPQEFGPGTECSLWHFQCFEE